MDGEHPQPFNASPDHLRALLGSDETIESNAKAIGSALVNPISESLSRKVGNLMQSYPLEQLQTERMITPIQYLTQLKQMKKESDNFEQKMFSLQQSILQSFWALCHVCFHYHYLLNLYSHYIVIVLYHYTFLLFLYLSFMYPFVFNIYVLFICFVYHLYIYLISY